MPRIRRVSTLLKPEISGQLAFQVLYDGVSSGIKNVKRPKQGIEILWGRGGSVQIASSANWWEMGAEQVTERDMDTAGGWMSVVP